jgi:plasmid maintenance system killer protein
LVNNNFVEGNKSVDILFKDEDQKELFNCEKSLKKRYGQMAKIITRRMDQLRAANSVGEYMAFKLGNPHFLKGDYKRCIAVSLTGNYRLIFEPVYEEDTDFANLNLFTLRVVTILEVEDYHGR